MRLKYLLLAAVAGLVGASVPVSNAVAANTLLVPLFTYRTGPFANSGIPIANGMHDYLSMLNARDGGIGGVKINVQECETQYNNAKGVECYDSVKDKNPLVIDPYSTGITLALIPKASHDHIPVLSMAYGLSASAVGADFPWIFNPPDTYWDGMSIALKYIAQKEGGGLAKLKGKTIGFIYLDVGYGREPIPLLNDFAKSYGFNVKMYPVPVSQMQSQSSVWLAVRRDRPDWMIMWGWGAMNPTAVTEAAKSGYPMDHFLGVWWSGAEGDAAPAGPAAKGYLSLNFNAVGANYPAIRDIEKYVIAKGNSQTPKGMVGENFYNRGVQNAAVIAEAIRNAQKITGKKVIDGSDMRRGLETLQISDKRWKQIGLPGFSAPIHISCQDHNGHGSVYVQQWNGHGWVKVSGWITPVKNKVLPLLVNAADDYVKQNQPWPKRTEKCDDGTL
jgi:branched-chain amino acid transport system substrate-binding protein